MLTYLEALCRALIARDQDAIRSLLAHPLAKALPRSVRDEALTVASGALPPAAAPLRAMRLYHQTARLLGTTGDAASNKAPQPVARTRVAQQTELVLEVSPY
jgi:hypothetical protein